jgi:hypothetical protein
MALNAPVFFLGAAAAWRADVGRRGVTVVVVVCNHLVVVADRNDCVSWQDQAMSMRCKAAERIATRRKCNNNDDWSRQRFYRNSTKLVGIGMVL